MEKSTIFLGLGSNIGDRLDYITKALKMIAQVAGVTVIEISPVYQTEPVGYEAQEDFFNMAVKAETSLEPLDLLSALQKIETDLGRVESVHKGPRTIDIDILLYGDMVVKEYRLEIPHPRMTEREFVLRPLLDIDPNLSIAALGVSVQDALDRIEGEKRVAKLDVSIQREEIV